MAAEPSKLTLPQRIHSGEWRSHRQEHPRGPPSGTPEWRPQRLWSGVGQRQVPVGPRQPFNARF
eukprot:scaffold11651_cov118-Isochrysis_galbana.AAC.2